MNDDMSKRIERIQCTNCYCFSFEYIEGKEVKGNLYKIGGFKKDMECDIQIVFTMHKKGNKCWKCGNINFKDYTTSFTLSSTNDKKFVKLVYSLNDYFKLDCKELWKSYNYFESDKCSNEYNSKNCPQMLNTFILSCNSILIPKDITELIERFLILIMFKLQKVTIKNPAKHGHEYGYIGYVNRYELLWL